MTTVRIPLLFTVIMFRWGDMQNHSYLLGTFPDMDTAVTSGQGEADGSGGKYDYAIFRHGIGSTETELVRKPPFANGIVKMRLCKDCPYEGEKERWLNQNEIN